MYRAGRNDRCTSKRDKRSIWLTLYESGRSASSNRVSFVFIDFFICINDDPFKIIAFIVERGRWGGGGGQNRVF